MKKKIIGIFICTLLISSSVIPLVGSIKNVNTNDSKEKKQDKYCPCLIDEANCYAYSDQQSGTLYSEEIDLNNYDIPAEVTFDTVYEINNPGIGYFEYSNDWDGVLPPSGSTWILLGTYQGFGSSTDTYSIPDSGYVRFKYVYASGSNDYGWMVDNFIVTDDLGTIVLEEDFESGAPGWQFTGGWYIRCIDCISFNKTVWDSASNMWVDEVTACVGDEVRIRLELCNCGEREIGQGHVVLYIWDTLPTCLEYVQGSSVPEEPTVIGNQLKWTFFDSGPDGLSPNDCITIEFNVEVVSTGQNKNCAEAQIEVGGGDVLHDSDCAVVNGIECGCIKPPDDLVAWWPLDEGNIPGGLSWDASINSNHGIWQGSPTATSGMVDGALNVPGSNNYVKVPDNPTLNCGTWPFTIDCWVRPTTENHIRMFVDKRSGSASAFNGYGLMLNSDGNLAMVLGTGSNYVRIDSTLSVPLNQWSFVAARVIPSNELVLIVDDLFQSFTISNFISSSNTGDLWIGKDHFIDSHSYTGDIDEVELYNRTLTINEIIEIYEAGSAGKCKPEILSPGNLNWDKVKPGTKATDTFTISNSGDSTSELNWEIESFPEWGTWTFKPVSGTNLKPEDGPVEVEVEVEAPDEKDAEFSGEIKIVNSNNPGDYEIISASLSTPKNKAYFNTLLIRLLENYPLLFNILRIFLQI